MKIILSEHANLKMRYYVQIIDKEISGMAKSTIVDGDIYVTDVMIFEQICDESNTSISDISQAKFMNELMVKGDEDIKNWNIWWHSHNDFGVFWSPNDDNTAEKNHDFQNYLISIVTNKAGEFKARRDIFVNSGEPFNIKLHNSEELEVEIEEIYNEELYEECFNDINEKIKEPEPEQTPIIFKNNIEELPQKTDTNWWNRIYGKKKKENNSFNEDDDYPYNLDSYNNQDGIFKY